MGASLEGGVPESALNGLDTILISRRYSQSKTDLLILSAPSCRSSIRSMSETDMRLVVDRYDIIVTQPGSDNVAVYFKPPGRPYLVAKDTPVGTQEFRTRAWELANAKARELGWLG